MEIQGTDPKIEDPSHCMIRVTGFSINPRNHIPPQWQIQDFPDGGGDQSVSLWQKTYYLVRFLDPPMHRNTYVHQIIISSQLKLILM